MSRTITGGVLMFGVPFLLLAWRYADLPAELPLLRSLIAGAITVAPKSLFIVFRVPLMNLTHGLMAGVMLSRASDFEDVRRRASYSGIFATLLFTVALKSNFEALELSALISGGPWLRAGTVVSVVSGLLLAVVRGRNVPMPWTELRLSKSEKILLAGLFTSYLAMVTASLFISRD